DPASTPRIAALLLHPAIEAALHLLNDDLPSAHFLVRHAQAAPAFESMLLHGLLHRLEGDMANARAWYADVGAGGDKENPVQGDSEGARLLRYVWRVEGEGEEEREDEPWMRFLSRVEQVRGAKGEAAEAERRALAQTGKAELKRVLLWCEAKFGTAARLDASDAWVRPGDKVQQTGNDMVTGGKGFRKF
ncbi:uncharacterized protein K452DRAFT_203853, partial [Aplosporella prunicola CBS 121167]